MLRSSGNCLLKFKLNAFKNFNKFSLRNFYFQETSHGAGEVTIKIYFFFNIFFIRKF